MSNVPSNPKRGKQPLSGYWCNPLPKVPGSDTVITAKAYFQTYKDKGGDNVPVETVEEQLSIFDTPQYGEIEVVYNSNLRGRLSVEWAQGEAPSKHFSHENETINGVV